MDALEQAIATFTARKERSAHPSGSFDKAGRWMPSDAEWQACCDSIRYPSRAYPYSYMVHCRTVDHVARLYGVNATDIRRATRAASKPRRLAGEFFKAVARVGDRLVSIYDGTTEYKLGETVVQAVRTGHGGGYYVRRTPHAALTVDVPSESALRDAERVVLKVRAEGQYTVYACGCVDCHGGLYVLPEHEKIAFSRVTPIEVVAL